MSKRAESRYRNRKAVEEDFLGFLGNRKAVEENQILSEENRIFGIGKSRFSQRLSRVSGNFGVSFLTPNLLPCARMDLLDMFCGFSTTHNLVLTSGLT